MNKVIGKNEKYALYFIEKTKQIFWLTRYMKFSGTRFRYTKNHVLVDGYNSSPGLKMLSALADTAQWIVTECRPANQRVASSIPSQGTCLVFRTGPQWGGCMNGNHTLMLLSLSFYFPSPLYENK